MIRRILVLLALLFVIFYVRRRIDKPSADNFIVKLRNFSLQHAVQEKTSERTVITYSGSSDIVSGSDTEVEGATSHSGSINSSLSGGLDNVFDTDSGSILNSATNKEFWSGDSQFSGSEYSSSSNSPSSTGSLPAPAPSQGNGPSTQEGSGNSTLATGHLVPLHSPALDQKKPVMIARPIPPIYIESTDKTRSSQIKTTPTSQGLSSKDRAEAQEVIGLFH